MKQTKPHLAVVGTGIAGLAAGWLLRDRYDVQLFEQNDYVGGHTHTVSVEERGRELAIDTGFIVYNEPNYPNLSALFAHLDVPTQATDMSFSASLDDGRVEYAGSDLGTLFAQRRNLVSLSHFRMLRDVLRFNRQAKALVRSARTASGRTGQTSLGRLLAEHGYSPEFRDRYLLPMAAAIWSAPASTMLEFPALAFARFYDNHGLLDLFDRPQWRTVAGGSHQYVRRLLDDLGGRVRLGAEVTGLERRDEGVRLRLADRWTRRFDAVVLAGHADQSLRLLDEPSPRERAFLSRFAYQANRAVLHTDARLMPRQRRVWSSWNYLGRSAERPDGGAVSVTYWMNRLQRLDSERDFFVSLNPLSEPRPDSVLAEFEYQHPVFDTDAMAVQGRLGSLQGLRNTWFCGSYFGYGFHEDALASALRVARALGVAPPWRSRQADAVEAAAPELGAALPQGVPGGLPQGI